MSVATGFRGWRTMMKKEKSIASALAASLVWGGLLLACPVLQGASLNQSPATGSFLEAQQDQSSAAQDKSQGAPDAAQAQRDREQEKKDREQERVDRMQELYEDGRGSLDEEDYTDAVKRFSELAKMAGPQTDAALYWVAYAENKLGNGTSRTSPSPT